MARRFLAVDDDPMILHILVSILRSEGHEVVAAPHGEAAVAILEAEPRPVHFDMIVSDVMMPGMSGLDLLQRVKSSPDTVSIPFMLLTAENQDDDIMQGYACGADYYIPKPFTRQQLLFAVQTLLPE